MIDGVLSSLYTFPYENDTICWTVAYTLTIALRHETHRFFVFGAYEGSYLVNLFKMYATYFTTIVASIFLRSALGRAAEKLPNEMLAIMGSRTWAYFGTVAFTGLFSYFALKRSWGKSSTNAVVPAQALRSRV